MPNPFDFIHELREFNRSLNARLDRIEEKLDELRKDYVRVDWYGDGK